MSARTRLTPNQRKIKSDVVALQIARLKEANRHERVMGGIEADIAALRSFCKHPERFHWHHHDPAGGYGSWVECRLCGGNVKRTNKEKHRE